MIESGLTLRKFAQALTESLPDFRISHATVYNWKSGKSEPDTDFLTLVASVYEDWRRAFALDVLAAKRPEVWGADGGIRVALEASSVIA